MILQKVGSRSGQALSCNGDLSLITTCIHLRFRQRIILTNAREVVWRLRLEAERPTRETDTWYHYLKTGNAKGPSVIRESYAAYARVRFISNSHIRYST